eukprot:7878984-Pyramimonas_sp.AAC.1
MQTSPPRNPTGRSRLQGPQGGPPQFGTTFTHVVAPGGQDTEIFQHAACGRQGEPPRPCNAAQPGKGCHAR